MGVWWHSYFLHGLESCLGPVRSYLELMGFALGRIDAQTTDVQTALRNAVAPVHLAAESALRGGFATLLDAAGSELDQLSIERQVATLMSLSLLEAHYSQCHATS